MADTALLLAALALTLLTLPGTIELTLLTVGASLPRRRAARSLHSPAAPLRLAVVVPAHDEERQIERCIRSVQACAAIDAADAIFVVADNCADDTAARAAAAGAIVLVRNDAAQRGKGFALGFAAEQVIARGYEVICIVDADSWVATNFIAVIRTTLDAGAAAVQTPYLVGNPAASLRTRLLHVAFLAFNNLRPRGRARLGLSAGLLGNGFALTAPVLQRVPFASAALAEDVEHHVRLLRAGYSVLWAEDTWVAAEMPVRASAAATQRARWEGGRGRLAIDWVPCLLRAVARGNSGLLEPLLELLLLPLTFHVLLLTLLLALPLPATQLYATLALTVVILHVALALAVGGATWRDVLVIGLVPLYLLWKLATLPAVMRSAARNAPWRRTERA